MTGAELVEIVRSKYPDLAVALMTGYAELPPGVAEGVPRLAKPFMQTQLLAFLAEITTPRFSVR
jgi:FixJ family two-component response regulator